MDLPKDLTIPQYTLDLEWRAVYDDGTELRQLANTPQESHAGHINYDKLVKFYVEGERGSFCIDLKTGEFDLNGTKMRFRLLDVPNEDLARHLVYFRRTRHDFHLGGEQTTTTVRHAIGWQASYEGKSHQRIVVIEPDNSFTILHRK